MTLLLVCACAGVALPQESSNFREWDTRNDPNSRMSGGTGNFREWDPKTAPNTSMGGNGGNFRQWDPRSDPNAMMSGNSSSFQKSDPRFGGASSVSFVGTIESVSVSNRTIEVSGQDSVVRTQYNQNLVYDSRTRTYVPDPNRRITNTNYKPTRTLQAAGESTTRTFEAGGFCNIEVEGAEKGRMGVGRRTLADLQVGQKVSIEYTVGIGGRFTAKSIRPFSVLNVTDAAPLKK